MNTEELHRKEVHRRSRHVDDRYDLPLKMAGQYYRHQTSEGHVIYRQVSATTRMVLEGLRLRPIRCPSHLALGYYVCSLRSLGFDIETHRYREHHEHWRTCYGIYELRGVTTEATLTEARAHWATLKYLRPTVDATLVAQPTHQPKM